LPTKETIEVIAFCASVATLVAAPLGLIGLLVAIFQLRASRRGASATTVIALNESFRQAWLHYSQVSDEGRQHAFADIMNLLEIACAIEEDKLLVAKGGKLLEDYLCHVLILIQQSEDARQRIERMFVTDRTFDHIINFLSRHRPEISEIKIPLAGAEDG
jgi:hypothetical protein